MSELATLIDRAFTMGGALRAWGSRLEELPVSTIPRSVLADAVAEMDGLYKQLERVKERILTHVPPPAEPTPPVKPAPTEAEQERAALEYALSLPLDDPRRSVRWGEPFTPNRAFPDAGYSVQR